MTHFVGRVKRPRFAGLHRVSTTFCHPIVTRAAAAASPTGRLATGLLPLAPSEYLVIVARKTPEAMVRST
jgi:hypothetical protein